MNLRLVAKQLGVVAMLISGTMVLCLPWAFPWLAKRTEEKYTDLNSFEWDGFLALLISVMISLAVGGLLWVWGQKGKGQLYRKEAMAIVGLSWVLATILGALPFWICNCYRSSSVRLYGADHAPQVFGEMLQHPLLNEDYRLIEALNNAGARGLTLQEITGQNQNASIQLANTPNAPQRLKELADSDPLWGRAIIFPDQEPNASSDRRGNFRLRPVRLNFADAIFESQSGFSTTGATIIADLEDPVLVPRCILFWRSVTHFLGGLGIIVMFVAILGQGSAGKALMRAEMPGPSKEGSQTRMQHTAWSFALMYVTLNAILTAILWVICRMTLFDALCHAFGTMATGGFSTYNASLGHFESDPHVNGALVEYIVVGFMALAGMNFTLLYFLAMFKPHKMWADVEWRTYMGIILLATLTIIGFGVAYGDFATHDDQPAWAQVPHALRYGLFQVVSIITTTGFGTHDFNAWNSFGRGLLFLLMFVGGCAGSTGGGLKVIRHILFHKILYLEVEHSFRPNVIRPLRIGGRPVDNPELRHDTLVYFGLILFIFVASWMALLTIEPDSTWGRSVDNKLLDTATSVAATLNNIGPGLGIVGSTQNYTNFSPAAKLLFTVLMMIGRLEIFAIIVLFVPGFWRNL